MTHASIDDIGPIHIGQDAEADISVSDGTGDALDLSGASVDVLLVELSARTVSTATIIDDDLAAIHASIGDGLTVIDEGGGTLEWTLSSADTEALADRTYHLRVRVTDGAGDVQPAAASGTVEVTPS